MRKPQNHLTGGSQIQILDKNVHLVGFVAMVKHLNLSELFIMESWIDALSKLNKSYLFSHGDGIRMNKNRAWMFALNSHLTIKKIGNEDLDLFLNDIQKCNFISRKLLAITFISR